MAKYLTPDQIHRRKKLQQHLTVGAASLGLAAVGAKTGSASLKVLKKAPKTASALSHTTNVTGTTAGAMGSISALTYSDLKNRKRPVSSKADEVLKLFDPEARRHKKSKAYVAGLGTASAVSGGAAGVMGLKRVKRSGVKTEGLPKESFPFQMKAPLKAKPSGKAIALAGAGSLASAGGAALIARHASKGGKTYTNKYEN